MKSSHGLFDELPVEDCHKAVLADVAWLRMVYNHLTDASKSLHNEKNSLSDRISNTYCPLENAIVYVQDMIYKSVNNPDFERQVAEE